MGLKPQWWSRLVAAVLGGLVSVTAVAAAGDQFLPVLGVREGPLNQLFDRVRGRRICRDLTVERGEAVEETFHLDIPIIAAVGFPHVFSLRQRDSPGHEVGQMSHDLNRMTS